MRLIHPNFERRAFNCAASLLALALSGCGGHSDRNRDVQRLAEGESQNESPPSSNIEIVSGGQSGNEGEGGSAYDTSDVVSEGETARSFVELGRLGPASLVRPLRHLYEEGRDGAAPRIGVYFQALFSQDLILSVELPDFVDATTLSLPSEAAVYLYETIGGESFDQVAVDGRIVVSPADRGVRVGLEDIVMRTGGGPSQEVFGDGVIEGEVERVCFYLAVLPDSPRQNGVPYPQHVQDETWSSPFCAQYR